MDITKLIFSKWGLMAIAVILIWILGGSSFIMRNPILIFFGILAMIIMGGKRR